MGSKNNIPSRYNWSFIVPFAKDLNLDELQTMYVNRILRKLNNMFKWKGLPDSIPQKDLEIILQTWGSATIARNPKDGKLYAFAGGLGGRPSPYYHPTLSIIANPYLEYNASLEIDKDCIVILNDTLYEGLMPLISQTSYLLAQADISFKFACINGRIPSLINAPNDKAKKEAESFLKQVTRGDNLGILGGTEIYKTFGVYPYANTKGMITDLIELKQYIMGTLYQELGINSPFNMKREAINEAEASLQNDVIIPTSDDMLDKRRLGCEAVNKFFGENWSVDFNGVWEDVRIKEDLGIELQEATVDELEARAESTEDTSEDIVDDTNIDESEDVDDES